MTAKEKLKAIYEETGLRYKSVKSVNWVTVASSKILSERFIELFYKEILASSRQDERVH